MNLFLDSLNIWNAVEDSDSFMVFKIPLSLWQTKLVRKAM